MGRHLSSSQQKIDWLVSHPDVWQGWPVRAPKTDDQIKDLMRKDGLISDRANNYDICDFGKLIGAARAILKSNQRTK